MPQRFTLEQAEALLPTLIPLVERMQELKATYDELLQSVAAVAGKARTNGHPPATAGENVKQRLEAATSDLNAVIEQIASHGCEVKDPSLGLLDFRTMHEGREVYLCWKAGEPRIEWWHDIHTGLAGRQPLDRD